MRACAVCSRPTDIPGRVALLGRDGLGMPFVACATCRIGLVQRATPGFRLVREDGRPMSEGAYPEAPCMAERVPA